MMSLDKVCTIFLVLDSDLGLAALDAIAAGLLDPVGFGVGSGNFGVRGTTSTSILSFDIKVSKVTVA